MTLSFALASFASKAPSLPLSVAELALTPGLDRDDAGASKTSKKDFLRLAVPARPLGFLCASVAGSGAGPLGRKAV